METLSRMRLSKDGEDGEEQEKQKEIFQHFSSNSRRALLVDISYHPYTVKPVTSSLIFILFCRSSFSMTPYLLTTTPFATRLYIEQTNTVPLYYCLMIGELQISTLTALLSSHDWRAGRGKEYSMAGMMDRRDQRMNIWNG